MSQLTEQLSAAGINFDAYEDVQVCTRLSIPLL